MRTAGSRLSSTATIACAGPTAPCCSCARGRPESRPRSCGAPSRTREPAAQRRLRALLRKPFEDVSGFDGVVAYSERGAPSLLSLPMSGHVRSEALRSATGEDAWGPTFCQVMPPISRLP